LIFVSVILIVFVIFILVLSILLISVDSVSSREDSMDYVALATVNRKLQDEFKYISKLESNNTPRKIIFSKPEVNALLAMLVSGSRMINLDRNIFSDILIRFNLGIFSFGASKKISFITPFGRYINIRSKFTFYLADKDVKIDVLCVKAGDINMPIFLIDYFINQNLSNINTIPLIQRLLVSVKEVRSCNDKLIIVYYPKSLRQAVSRLRYGIRHKMRLFHGWLDMPFLSQTKS